MTTREMAPEWESNGNTVSARYVRTARGAFQLMAHKDGGALSAREVARWQWDLCVDSGVLDNGSAETELAAQKAADNALFEMCNEIVRQAIWGDGPVTVGNYADVVTLVTLPTEPEKKYDINAEIQKIKELNQKLTSLLDDPQPGIAMWVTFVGKRIEEMYAIVHPTTVSAGAKR